MQSELEQLRHAQQQVGGMIRRQSIDESRLNKQQQTIEAAEAKLQEEQKRADDAETKLQKQRIATAEAKLQQRSPTDGRQDDPNTLLIFQLKEAEQALEAERVH